MKQCTKCKTYRHLDMFNYDKSRKDKLNPWCKACCKIYAQKYRQSERGKKVRNDYYYSEHGTTARKTYRQSERGKRVSNRIHKKYTQTDNGKTICRKGERRYARNNKDKRNAKAAVNGAVKYNKIPRANTNLCDDCNEQADHYHHWSYEKQHWLDVIPLCASCHRLRHRATETA